MKTILFFTRPWGAVALFSLILSTGCDKTELRTDAFQPSGESHRLDIGLDALLEKAEITVSVAPRSPGYFAEARGNGTIPAGEYAGQKFHIVIEGYYSDIGLETLESGEALVKIRSQRFESVMDPLLQSFCCGEGHLQLVDGEYVFTMFGQVNHSTAAEPHNHLFAGLASTAGFMNMNIEDQSGTVVIPADPPHDPEIGLIEGFEAVYVRVEEH